MPRFPGNPVLTACKRVCVYSHRERMDELKKSGKTGKAAVAKAEWRSKPVEERLTYRYVVTSHLPWNTVNDAVRAYRPAVLSRAFLSTLRPTLRRRARSWPSPLT